jgi:hypothetical protein
MSFPLLPSYLQLYSSSASLYILSSNFSITSPRPLFTFLSLYQSNFAVRFCLCPKNLNIVVRFEVFTAVTMKNGVFWDVTPCGSCKNRRFGGT